MGSLNQRKLRVNARINEYAVPPIKDMLVLGKNSPIGCIAMRRALKLLVKTPFEHIEIVDDCISDILIRQSLLLRISEEELIEFVLSQVKPMLSVDEVLHLELDIHLELDVNVN